VTFRSSNIECCRYVKRFALLLYQLTDLRLPNYNRHSIQYAAVSQPDTNELAAMKFPVRSANDLQTDDYTKYMIDTIRTVGYKEPLECSRLLLHVDVKFGKYQRTFH